MSPSFFRVVASPSQKVPFTLRDSTVRCRMGDSYFLRGTLWPLKTKVLLRHIVQNGPKKVAPFPSLSSRVPTFRFSQMARSGFAAILVRYICLQQWGSDHVKLLNAVFRLLQTPLLRIILKCYYCIR